jgi:ElaA protein
MIYNWLPFAELTSKQVYDILQVREDVFHLEHGAQVRDIDDLDLQSKHLLGYEGEQLIAYLRVYLKNDCLYIDRLVVATRYRLRGLGSLMVQKTLENLKSSYPGLAIGVRVWSGVLDFYHKCDFGVASNEPMSVTGFEPIEMRYKMTHA